MNNLNIVGRLGRDPESRNAGDKMVCEFSVAVSHGRDRTSWFNIKAWGKAAELAMAHLHKGDLVGVTGQHIEESWTSKEGEPRKKWVVDAQRIHLMPNNAPAQRQADDEDLPF